MKKIIIGNLTELFKSGLKKPFKILGALEDYVFDNTNVSELEFISIPYSDNIDVIFTLYKLEYKDNINVYYFNYSSTVS